MGDTRPLPLPAGLGNLGNSVHIYTDDALAQNPTVDGTGLGAPDSPFTAVAPEPRAVLSTPREDIPMTFEDDEAVIHSKPGLAKAIETAALNQEQDFRDASIALLNNAGIPHERQKITISDLPIRTPSYANSLSETYGALNVWRQIRLMKMIMHKMKELDADAWEISCNKKTLMKEIEELDNQLVALQTKSRLCAPVIDITGEPGLYHQTLPTNTPPPNVLSASSILTPSKSKDGKQPASAGKVGGATRSQRRMNKTTGIVTIGGSLVKEPEAKSMGTNFSSFWVVFCYFLWGVHEEIPYCKVNLPRSSVEF